MQKYNPCLTCGACCAFYRASFYWAEGDDTEGGTVPVTMTEKLDHFRLVMKGTNQPKPRCVALDGEIGACVKCSTYESRPSVCREFPFSWENGEPHERCDKARVSWGLPPLAPPSFTHTDDLPKAA